MHQAADDQTSENIQALRRTDLDWIKIGQDEPYHGVLSHERFLRRNLTPQTMMEFWRSGEEEVQYLTGVLDRLFGAFRPSNALDFGCGVGRLTRAMANIAAAVVGLDIAPGMLAEARRGAPANIRFMETLGEQTFDWINSIIVFQHIPPARGYGLFDDLVGRLAPGGMMSIQFTLYRDKAFLPATVVGIEEAAWDGEMLRPLHQSPAPAGTMLMYDYDLNRVIATAVRHGLEHFYLEHTNHGGCHGVRLFARRTA